MCYSVPHPSGKALVIWDTITHRYLMPMYYLYNSVATVAKSVLSFIYSKNVYSSHEMTTAFQLDFQLILAGKDLAHE